MSYDSYCSAWVGIHCCDQNTCPKQPKGLRSIWVTVWKQFQLRMAMSFPLPAGAGGGAVCPGTSQETEAIARTRGGNNLQRSVPSDLLPSARPHLLNTQPLYYYRLGTHAQNMSPQVYSRSKSLKWARTGILLWMITMDRNPSFPFQMAPSLCTNYIWLYSLILCGRVNWDIQC